MSNTQTLEAPEVPVNCSGMTPPAKEHEWLQKLAGVWTSEGEANCAPDQPPMRLSGTETTRIIGGFWSVTEIESDQVEMPYTQILTMGYNPEKKKYYGTVVDSMGSHLWQLEGTVDPSGRTLTMETEGPFPCPGQVAKFREVTVFKSHDHKVFTSSIVNPDGSLTTLMTVEARRNK